MVRRTFQPRSRRSAREPRRSSASTANQLKPATPSPRATASFTPSIVGSSSRLAGVIPRSAHAASTAAWSAEPWGCMIHVAASASRRDRRRPAYRGEPTTTMSSSTSGSASISGAAANPPTTPNSARCARSASIVCADGAGTILTRTPGYVRWNATATSGRR